MENELILVMQAKQDFMDAFAALYDGIEKLREERMQTAAPIDGEPM